MNICEAEKNQVYIRCPKCSYVYEVTEDCCPKCKTETMISEGMETEPVFNLND